MKTKRFVVMGLTVLVAGCGSSPPAAAPPSSTPGTVRSPSTSITVPPGSTPTTAKQATGQPPPVPHCYYTGSGYGDCEGYVIPQPGTVVLFTHPDKDGISG